ncbi:MAG: type IX secretion system membrane protein PorP/SprF [Bacteroidales bacterium]|jgi:type IX secretion system PorP/SprF family membrane protein|nr:type IX secretion system membrane protein PorP/SprF [Bacteroidales bacterium]
MKYIFLWMCGSLWFGWNVRAQQVPVSSLFVENRFLFNPSVAGTDEAFKVRMDNRFQWQGFIDAPITNLLSAYGPHKNSNIGYGGTIGYDSFGPSGKFTMNGAFAVNFALGGSVRLSTGVNFGFLQYRVDGSQLELDSPDDPNKMEDDYAPATLMSAFLPDAAAGAYLYHPKWYAGVSALQLFNNNIKFNGMNSGRNKLKTHFYGIAGARLPLGEQWTAEPAAMARILEATPLQLDITARIIFREQFWGGVNVRNTFQSFQDASVMLGYIHNGRINIGIAYDYTTSQINQYTTGTIELMIGYNFDAIRNRN